MQILHTTKASLYNELGITKYKFEAWLKEKRITTISNNKGKKYYVEVVGLQTLAFSKVVDMNIGIMDCIIKNNPGAGKALLEKFR